MHTYVDVYIYMYICNIYIYTLCQAHPVDSPAAALNEPQEGRLGPFGLLRLGAGVGQEQRLVLTGSGSLSLSLSLALSMYIYIFQIQV